MLASNAFKRSLKLPATTHTASPVTSHSKIHSVSSGPSTVPRGSSTTRRVGLPLRREQGATEIREASTERGRREKHKHVLCLRGYDWRLAQLPAARQRCPLSPPSPLPPIPVLDTLVTSFFPSQAPPVSSRPGKNTHLDAGEEALISNQATRGPARKPRRMTSWPSCLDSTGASNTRYAC